MIDRSSFEQAGQRLASWERTMILSHDRADGDALGAMAAMQHLITAAGRQATAFVYDQIPPRYAFLNSTACFAPWPAKETATLDARFDGVLILDTCSWSQLEPATDYLRAGSRPRIVVDHHATRDELSGPRADVLYLIDASAAASCGIVYAWCEAIGWTIDAAARDALFAGVATDTGWFRFSNTNGQAMRMTAALIEQGVRPDEMYSRIYASHSPARFRLKAEMLATLEFHAKDAVAVMRLTRAMFDRAGATSSDSEDLVNEAIEVGPVAVAVLLSEMDNGLIRVNFRSKSPEACGRDVDVSSLAKAFGGGGHRRAAGARIAGKLEQVRQRVISAVLAAV